MEIENINILIVEDNISFQEMYRSSIKLFNDEIKETNKKIEATFLVDDSEIPNRLFYNHFDAIFIDLVWKEGTTNPKGVELLEKLYHKCRLPIFVVSGNLTSLDEELFIECDIFKKISKDCADINMLLQDVMNLYESGFTKTLGNNSKIDEELNYVYWNYISKQFYSWKSLDDKEKCRRMLRFMTTRLNEKLKYKEIEDGMNHDEYDSLEFYIIPAMSTEGFTGDIIMYNGKQYVILSPACDLENCKMDYVLICMIDFQKFAELKTAIQVSTSKTKINDLKDKLNRYVDNNVPRYHLLPPCTLFNGGFVDFQAIEAVNKDELKKMEIIATINPVFSKDIRGRFAQYYNRQGQPQLNCEKIFTWMQTN